MSQLESLKGGVPFGESKNGFRIPFGKSGESFLKKDSLDLNSEESKFRLTDYWPTLFQFTRSIIRIQICRKEREIRFKI